VSLVLLLAAGTLVSEDLTCVAAGVMAATGKAGFLEATLGCLLGIYAGDLLLYAAGRCLGRAFLDRRPLSWLVSREKVETAASWFGRRGSIAILLARPIPGTRLPVYVASGLFRMPFGAFAAWCLLGASIWTPLLVGASFATGGRIASLYGPSSGGGLAGTLAGGLAAFLAVRLASALASRRGRKLLLGRWRRLTRWEFWPRWALYPPVVAFVLYQGLRHRSLTLFTLANPGIEGGGFSGESKSRILRALRNGGAPVARFEILPARLPREGRLDLADRFMAGEGIGFPAVLKPDVGQRGEGVSVVRNREELAARLARSDGDQILQEFVEGPELGIFYVRMPGEPRGRIFSITEKRLPVLLGDGRRTIEDLILDDDRAVCLGRTHLDRMGPRLGEIPRAGEEVPLVEIGSHCRGAVFLDGERLRSTALEDAIDRASRGFEGFCFGRYDVRGPSFEDLAAGRGLRILELNGVTSESTDIYDPSRSLLHAWRRLFDQWRLAFEIGRRHRARGLRPASLADLIRLALAPRPGRSLPSALVSRPDRIPAPLTRTSD